jgi:dihydroorotase
MSGAERPAEESGAGSGESRGEGEGRAAADIDLRRPDDWHMHLRDGPGLATSVAHAARQFARAIVMPNLRPPVTTVAAAQAYRERILRARPDGARFEPLMTLYLTDSTPPEEIARARASGFVHAVKYYPAGATTNSDSGVTAMERAFPALEAMERHGVPLLVHGEVTFAGVDVFDRERIFVEQVLPPVIARFPTLRVVVEHVTTRAAVEFVAAASPLVAATITPHHLLFNRNALFEGGIRPHMYCLPVLKREEDRRALIAAATGPGSKFFLGTDSAPHDRSDKESACGHGGIYSAHAAIELYAEAFDSVGALDRLEAFASLRGPAFYGLAPNEARARLRRVSWEVPPSYPFGDGTVVPLRAGHRVGWTLLAG